jgi:Outer membrane protein beta-barrel domain
MSARARAADIARQAVTEREAMIDLSSFWADLVGRLTGPMTFRIVFQPLMSMSYAVRDGVRDARQGRPAYFWALFTRSSQRRALLEEGWRAVFRVIVLGVVMDVIYQLIVDGNVRLVELVFVVLVLAFLPYLLLRGPVNRIARRWVGTRTALSIVLVCCLTMVPATAAAQPRRIFVDVGMGPTAVFGSASDNVGPGFNFGVGVTGKLSPHFDVKIDTLVTKHTVKDRVAAGLGVGNGNGWLWHLSGNAVVSAPLNRVVSVYGVGGIGVYYRKVTLATPGSNVVAACNAWLLICYPAAVPANQVAGERSTAGAGLNIGGGLHFRTGDAAVFVETRFHYVWSPSMSTQGGRTNVDSEILPITFGIRF